MLRALTTLTASRDRDAIASGLARLLFDQIEPQRVTVFSLIDDMTERRVRRQASVDASGGEEGLQLAPVHDLPLLADHLEWSECVDHGRPVRAPVLRRGVAGMRYVFPLHGERRVQSLVEIEIEIAHARRLARRRARVVDLLGVVANHLAALDYGERDALTGLLSRRTLDAQFARARDLAIALPPGRSGARDAGSWFAVLDVDHFKRINDTQGHLFGDEVLLIVSKLIRQNLRGTDLVFRYGGEEFAVIPNWTDADGALVALERVRGKIESHRFPQIGRVTVSIGYTQVRASDISALAIERADAALYYVRSNGRNQCAWFEALVQAGHLTSKEDRAEIELF